MDNREAEQAHDAPHWGHAPVHMKRVATPDDVNNVGEFAWGTKSGKRHIMLALPCPRDGAPTGFAPVYLPIVLGVSTVDARGWDGNEDKPTLTTELPMFYRWRGWVLKGMMEETKRGKRQRRPMSKSGN